VGYHAVGVTVADAISDVWLRGRGEPPRTVLREVTGCASVHGAPPPSPAVPFGTHFLLIYLAEAATEADAATIAGAAGVRHDGAAAVGVATVTLFGPSDRRLTAPRGAAARILDREVPCSPCFRPTCPIDHICLTRIQPETVRDEVRGAIA